ncbi:NERD domain protein [Paenarthrobacter nitroguajacolicus]|nr:NERD domain protein [Paenarthrobacter nitroguajacolicus]
MRLRYSGVCRQCGTSIAAGTEAIYERETRTVRCLACATEPEQALYSGPEPTRDGLLSPAAGTAGSSARREYERRKTKDQDRLREKWGRFGALAVGLSNERPSTQSWAQGAIGEERLGAGLDAVSSDSLAILHDRRIPGSKANIDHIAVTPGGVWVVDAKRYKGRPELEIEGGFLRPRVEKLLVGRRDSTKLVDGVLKQVDVVRKHAGDVPVNGVLCFIEADWPLVGGAFTTRGVHVLWPKRLTKVLVAQASGDVDVARMRELLASRFRPA